MARPSAPEINWTFKSGLIGSFPGRGRVTSSATCFAASSRISNVDVGRFVICSAKDGSYAKRKKCQKAFYEKNLGCAVKFDQSFLTKTFLRKNWTTQIFFIERFLTFFSKECFFLKNVFSKIDFFVNDRTFCQRSQFLSKIEKILSKIEMFVKDRIFFQRSKFCQRSNILSKIQILSNIEILSKIFRQISIFDKIFDLCFKFCKLFDLWRKFSIVHKHFVTHKNGQNSSPEISPNCTVMWLVLTVTARSSSFR